MLITSFFKWWYSDGWLDVADSLTSRAQKVSNSFSITILLKTLFKPWRRIISYPGAGLDAKFHAFVDNLFSRVVGFFVRLFVLIAAVIILALTTLETLIETLAWPLLPPAIIGFIVVAIAV